MHVGVKKFRLDVRRDVDGRHLDTAIFLTVKTVVSEVLKFVRALMSVALVPPNLDDHWNVGERNLGTRRDVGELRLGIASLGARWNVGERRFGVRRDVGEFRLGTTCLGARQNVGERSFGVRRDIDELRLGTGSLSALWNVGERSFGA